MDGYTLAKLVFLAITIYSLISYKFRRIDNKQNLTQYLDNRERIRKITSEEQKLLQPYLDDKWSVFPYKHQSSLVDFYVSKLAGTVSHHSLYTNADETSYYFSINEVEVFFPYHMHRYMSDFNIVEVVCTKQYAIVIKINGHDLQTAADIFDPNIEYDELFPVDLDKSSYNENSDTKLNSDNNIADLQSKNNPINDYELLQEREETPLELANRKIENNDNLTVFCFVCSVMLFAYSWYSANPAILILVIFCFLLFIFFKFYIPKSRYNSNKVTRIRGIISDKDPHKKEITVGQHLILKVPHYWLPLLPEQSSTQTEMDITEEGNNLIQYSHSLSINREIELFGPPKFIKYNVILLIIGIIFTAIIYFQTKVSDNTLLVYRFFENTIATWHFEDDKTLKTSPIQKGDLVNIHMANISCDVTEKMDIDKCKTLFIANQPIDFVSKDEPLANSIKELFSVGFIKDDDRNMTDYLLYQNRLYQRDPATSYAYTYGYTKLFDINKIITTIDRICTIDNIKCDPVQEEMLYILSFQILNWDDLVESAKKNPNHLDSALVEKTDVSRLNTQVEELKKQVIELLKAKITNYQQNKSSLKIDLSYSAQKGLDQAYFIDSAKADKDPSVLSDYYSNILFAKNQPITIFGLVTNITYNDDNTISGLDVTVNPYYQMDVNKLFSLTSPILISLLIFISTALVTLINGIVLCWKSIYNKRRKEKILNLYQNQII